MYITGRFEPASARIATTTVRIVGGQSAAYSGRFVGSASLGRSPCRKHATQIVRPVGVLEDGLDLGPRLVVLAFCRKSMRPDDAVACAHPLRLALFTLGRAHDLERIVGFLRQNEHQRARR